MRDDQRAYLKSFVSVVCFLLLIASGLWMVNVESAPLWLGKIVFWAFFMVPLSVFLILHARAVTHILLWLFIFWGISSHRQ